jgi:hypothetical protein
LNDALGLQLRHALDELLVLGGLLIREPREAFRREARNRIKLDRWPGTQRIANLKDAWISKADHIAGKGLVDRLTLARKQAMRASHADRPPQPRVVDEHVLGKSARADPQERHTIAMQRIHIRLNLEHKSGEAFAGGIDQPAVAGARAGRRRQAQQRIQERLDTEVVERAAEEHRCQVAVTEAGVIEQRASALQQIDLVVQPAVRRCAQQLTQRQIIDCGDMDRRAMLAMAGTLEQQHALADQIVYTLKRRPAADRPVHRRGADLQDALDRIPGDRAC